jgi:hypothetical protein
MMMLSGPPGRGNGGCINLSPAGLLAHGAGTSVVISDPHSMQLLCVLPMPSSSMASFGLPWGTTTTASLSGTPVRGPCSTLNLDETRVIMLVSVKGVQDLCWIHHASGWLLTTINVPSLLCIWETSHNPRVLWMFDVTPETTTELEAKLDKGRRLTVDKSTSTICDRVLHSNRSPIQQIDQTEQALNIVQGVATVVDVHAAAVMAVPAS